MLASFYRDIIANKEGELATDLHNLISAITGKEEVASQDIIKQRTKKLYSTLEKPWNEGGIGWENKKGRQEDAEELLTSIINKLEFNKIYTVAKLSSKDSDDKAIEKNLTTDKNTKLYIYFKPNQQGKYEDINLQNSIDNLFSQPEEIEFKDFGADNAPKYKNIFLDGNQKLEDIYGKTLIVVPQRTESRNNTIEKISQKVTLPNKLQLKKEYFSPNIQEDIEYTLMGFIQHIGTNSGSGHYVAYAKVNEKWVKYNDTTVTECDSVPAEEAYIYFYQQVMKNNQS